MRFCRPIPLALTNLNLKNPPNHPKVARVGYLTIFYYYRYGMYLIIRMGRAPVTLGARYMARRV